MIKSNKKLIVPSQYFSYKHIDSVNQILKPLFSRSSINYFDYSRVFFDGSWTLFTAAGVRLIRNSRYYNILLLVNNLSA